MFRTLTRVVWFALGLSVLAGGAFATWWYGYGDVYLAQNRVREALIDPDSGRFSGVYYNENTKNACGYVNAKNRLGGYVGMRPFILTKDGAVEFGSMKSDAGDIYERGKSHNAWVAFQKKMLLVCSNIDIDSPYP